jgi:hypothetical protein
VTWEYLIWKYKIYLPSGSEVPRLGMQPHMFFFVFSCSPAIVNLSQEPLQMSREGGGGPSRHTVPILPIDCLQIQEKNRAYNDTIVNIHVNLLYWRRVEERKDP